MSFFADWDTPSQGEGKSLGPEAGYPGAAIGAAVLLDAILNHGEAVAVEEQPAAAVTKRGNDFFAHG